jgi:hypothetical protein
MGLFKKLRTPIEEHDRAKLADFSASFADATRIADVQPRQYATVVGEITSVRIVPKTDGSPWLEATVKDGSGAIVAMWTGRRRMPGIRTGRRIKMSGRGGLSHEANRLKVLNPEYELLG